MHVTLTITAECPPPRYNLWLQDPMKALATPLDNVHLTTSTPVTRNVKKWVGQKAVALSKIRDRE